MDFYLWKTYKGNLHLEDHSWVLHETLLYIEDLSRVPNVLQCILSLEDPQGISIDRRPPKSRPPKGHLFLGDLSRVGYLQDLPRFFICRRPLKGLLFVGNPRQVLRRLLWTSILRRPLHLWTPSQKYSIHRIHLKDLLGVEDNSKQPFYSQTTSEGYLIPRKPIRALLSINGFLRFFFHLKKTSQGTSTYIRPLQGLMRQFFKISKKSTLVLENIFLKKFTLILNIFFNIHVCL